MNSKDDVLSGSKKWTVIQGDCIEELKKFPADSIDSVVCDPPYGLEFMGKKWDSFSKGGYDSGNGYANRETPTFDRRWTNKRCTKCNHISSGGSPCRCLDPTWVLEHGIAVDKSNQFYQEWCLQWAREVLRVLKPGGHLLAFGGTRTQHRLVCAIEDAGFEIRDSIDWVYGSGFPKSYDIAQSIEKMATIGKTRRPDRDLGGLSRDRFSGSEEGTLIANTGGKIPLTTPLARKWEGWGSAIKPAHEPIVVARKPLSESTIAKNVLKYGTGGLNIDGCRVENGARPLRTHPEEAERLDGVFESGYKKGSRADGETSLGRWPANFLVSHADGCVKKGTKKIKGGGLYELGLKPMDDAGNKHADEDGLETVDEWICIEGCPVRLLDMQSGERKSGMMKAGQSRKESKGKGGYHGDFPDVATEKGTYGDSGGASRFFNTFEPDIEPFKYVAKASRSERERGCESLPVRTRNRVNAGGIENDPKWAPTQVKNHHCTVKPIALMKWLCRLVTPPGGIVLDPFTGSGSTGCAAMIEGFRFIGIEKDAEYVEIANARISHYAKEEVPIVFFPIEKENKKISDFMSGD